jgi:hypothetical protein
LFFNFGIPAILAILAIRRVPPLPPLFQKKLRSPRLRDEDSAFAPFDTRNPPTLQSRLLPTSGRAASFLSDPFTVLAV